MANEKIACERYQPLVFWGKDQILTQSGRLLKFKTKEDLKLVNIEANRNNIDFVLRYFFELNQILKGSNLVLNRILIEEFDLMTLEVNSGIRFHLNKSKIENQLENLKTFLKSKYFNNIKDTFSYLDLRYQNKGAIGFRD